MSDGGALIDLSKFGDAAKVLVEKISGAVGMVYEPRYVRNMARAESDAVRIRALAAIDLQDELDRRTMARMLGQERRKQANLDRIVGAAVSQLDGATPDSASAMTEDWVAVFLDQAGKISDEEMQSLWSKILAGEASKPGTFSKRTLDVVSKLDKSEADAFTRLCSFAWHVGGWTPLIFDMARDAVYVNAGITFDTLNTLSTAGLITIEPNGYKKKVADGTGTIVYGARAWELELPKNQFDSLQIGNVLFTGTGIGLLPICGASTSNEIETYVLDRLKRSGLVVTRQIDLSDRE